MTEVKIKYMDPKMAKLGKKYPGDAGIDLRIRLSKDEQELWLSAGQKKTVGTGIKLDIPSGFGAYVLPRSSISNLGVLVSTGVIDSGYQGEIMVTIKNMNNHALIFEDHQRVAQLVFFPVPVIEMKEVLEFDEITVRGEKGFGSTGKK